VNLSAAEIEAIREESSHYEDKAAAAIEALKIVQQQRGWISDENIKDIAALLEMSPAELDSVATFYNLIYRKPVGKKVIHYCDSVSCWMLGAENNRQYLGERLGIGLGETTADGEYTLLPIVCLGACDRAPVLMIGERTYFNVDRAKLNEILEQTGQP
jgi:NADH-quinone oxidoreductase subunit E